MKHNLKKVSEVVLNIIFICILIWFTYKVYLETGFYTAILSIYFNIKIWYAKEVVKTAATIFRKAKNEGFSDSIFIVYMYSFILVVMAVYNNNAILYCIQNYRKQKIR